MAQNTSLKLKWLWSLSPSLQLDHMAPTLQIPLLNFNMGARINHCHTVDTVMGMGVDDMQHTMASPRQSQTLGTDIHLPFRDQFDKWQQTSKGLAPSSPSLATDTKRLATDKQLVLQQTIRLRVLKFTLVPRPTPFNLILTLAL